MCVITTMLCSLNFLFILHFFSCQLYSGIITKSHPKYKFSKNMTAKVTSCRNSKASRNANRNVGQLSCRLKRQMQRHDMNCKTISYDSLVTFHSMWLEYARELLCIDHYKKQGWTANPCDTATETIQNKFKKIEYFGAQCEVTASSCTSLVGLKGIIIKESKSCFTVVTKDNLVKNVPKVNSEFMFEIDGVQFIVMGAHIYQRPVERAKHNLKKLHLWTCGRP